MLVTLAAVLVPTPARAHLNSTGMGPIYDGLLHVLTSPEDLVPVLGLALFAGLRGARYGREALFVLPASWLLGGLLGLTASAANGSAGLSATWFLLLGGLVAANARLSLRMTTALAALVGLYHGYVNGTGMARPGSAVVALVGLVSAVFVMVALTAAFVVRLRRVDAHRRARGRKLDRRQRLAVAGLGRAKKLRPSDDLLPDSPSHLCRAIHGPGAIRCRAPSLPPTHEWRPASPRS